MVSDQPAKHIVSEVLLFSAGLAVFSCFIQHPFPVVLLAGAGLFIPAFIISRHLQGLKDVPPVFGLPLPQRKILYVAAGLLLGVVYALVYRATRPVSLFPVMLTGFAIPAALIGAAEELVFRGFLQGLCRKLSVLFAVFFATVAHTLYKGCLFLSPANTTEVRMTTLLIWTFVGGLAFGMLREKAKSSIPAVLAHLVFDVLVYGELMKAPGWVW